MELEMEKKNYTKPIIIVTIGLLVALLIIIGFAYKSITNNPVKITSAVLEIIKEGDYLNNNFAKVLDFIEDADALETKMDGKVTLPMDYGVVNLDLLLQNNNDARKALMNLNLDINGSSMYLEGQLDRNSILFAFKENAPKYYYTTDIQYQEIPDLDYEDIIDYIKESFQEIVKNDDFKESSKNIFINDKNLKTKQYSLGISEQLVARVTNRIVEKVLNDYELVNSIAKISGYTEYEIRAELNNLKVPVDQIPDLNTEIEAFYNIYVSKNRPVRFEFVTSNDDNNLYFDNYQNIEIGFDYTDEYNQKTTLIIKENNDNWTLNLDSEDLQINGTINDNKYYLSLNYGDVSVIIDCTADFAINSNNISILEKGLIKITQSGTSIEIPFEFNIKYKEINKVNFKNIINKVDINNMNSKEAQEFQNELLQIPLISSLISLSTSNYGVSY